MVDFLRIFLGSYEHYLLRYDIQLAESDNDKKEYNFVNIFAQQTHTATVKCIDIYDRYLATGGADDRISIIDLKLNLKIQQISIHDGTVNALKFSPDGSYLFSASDDGRLVAIKTGSWITHQIWNSPHTSKSVCGITIHPSGKLAMTFGNDLTIRTWNLLKGKQVCTTNVKDLLRSHSNGIESVNFSPNGDTFSLIGGKELIVVSVSTGDILRQEQCNSMITSICWLNDKSLFLGHQNGFITFVRIDCTNTAEFDCSSRDEFNKDKNGKTFDSQASNGTRIKQMCMHNNFLVTVMSCGALALWRFMRKSSKLKYIKSINIGCRPVCMNVIGPMQQFPMPIKEISSNDNDIEIKTEEEHDDDEQQLDVNVSEKDIEKIEKKKKKNKNFQEASSSNVSDNNDGQQEKKKKKKKLQEDDDSLNGSTNGNNAKKDFGQIKKKKKKFQ